MNRRLERTRAWIVYLLAVVLLAFGSVSFARRLGATEPFVGVEWVQSSSGPLALSVEPGSPAWAAGILPGDTLQRVNGRAVRHALDAAEFPWGARLEEPTRLQIRRGRQVLHLELAPGQRYEIQTAPLYGYLALVGLAFLVSGVFFALRWPTIRGGQVYALLGASLFGLMVFSPTGEANFLDWTISWLDMVAGALAPALLLHLAMSVSRRAWPRRRLGLLLSYAPAAGLLLSALWLVSFGGMYRFEDPVLVLEARDRFQMLFLSVAVLLAAALFARSYSQSASGLHRSQMRWLIWGLATGLLPFVLFYAIPWSLEASVPAWAGLSVFPMLLMPAAFTAALVRYRLHDLDLLLRRGLTEVTAVFFTLAVYAASQFILRREGAGLLPLSNSGARYFGILISAIAYPQLRSWVRMWVDRAFYRKRYSYRATLLDWARELNAETDLTSLLERVGQRVRDTLAVPDVRLLLRTGKTSFDDPLRPEETSPVELPPSQVLHLEEQPCLALEECHLPGIPWARYLFGMRVKGRLRAVLAVAERESSEGSLSTEDRALLSTLSAQAATAIEAARLLREVREGAREVGRLQARQERILESSGIGLLLVEDDGGIVAWNRALEAICGLPREEAIGRRLEEVFPLHLVRAIEAEVQSAPSGEEARLYRYGLVNRTGQRVIVNISVSLASEEEEAGARVVSLDDVTERVKLEEQVLRQERLAALGLVAAGVAHEVNTPLTGISSYTQMLLEDLPPGDPRKEILEKIEVQSRRATNIANSLLNLARPQESSFETLSLNETIGEVLRLFEPQTRGGAIRMEKSLAPDLPPVRGHKGKLQQVLLNLLLNARDAVGKEGRITLVTRHQEGHAVFEVTDDGAGIATEDLPRIFDPFFTTKGRGKGTGLGLSISYAIVREHEGEIQVDSVPGELTRFRVLLPAAHSAVAAGRS